jgi:uncharacterized protein
VSRGREGAPLCFGAGLPMATHRPQLRHDCGEGQLLWSTRMIVAAWITVGLGAAVQAITGFGFSLVSAPFLIAAYHAPEGIQINLVLSVVLNLSLTVVNRRSIEFRSAATLFVPAALATVAVGLALKSYAGTAWTIAAGALCLLGTLVVWSGASFPRLRGTVATAVVGSLSGAMNVTTGVGGPPVVLFAINSRWSPAVSRATLQAYFLGINAIGIATLGLPHQLPLAVIVAVAAGVVLGSVLSGRLPVQLVRRGSLVLAAVGSVLVIVRAA